jgi:acetyl esterase/lipase
MFASERQFAPDGWTEESAQLVKKARSLYPVNVEEATIAGVKVKIVNPQRSAANLRDRVMINLHGRIHRRFRVAAGEHSHCLAERDASHRGRLPVGSQVSVPRRAMNDSVAVYKELLKTRAPGKIAVFGTSAGAILTAQVPVHMGRLGLRMSAALGFFSGYADFARQGDSRSIYSVRGFT